MGAKLGRGRSLLGPNLFSLKLTRLSHLIRLLWTILDLLQLFNIPPPPFPSPSDKILLKRHFLVNELLQIILGEIFISGYKVGYSRILGFLFLLLFTTSCSPILATTSSHASSVPSMLDIVVVVITSMFSSCFQSRRPEKKA